MSPGCGRVSALDNAARRSRDKAGIASPAGLGIGASYAAASNAARAEFENEQLVAQVDLLRAALRLILVADSTPEARAIAREALR